MIELRDYQSAMVDKAATALLNASERYRCAAVLPTGAGKTIIFAALSLLVQSDIGRILVIEHSEELVTQTADKYAMVGPGVAVGQYGCGVFERGADVTVSSIQTLHRDPHLHSFDPYEFGLIIVDECHHAAAATYRKVLNYFQGHVLGVTATLDHASKSLGDVFPDGIIYRTDILDLINAGYLVDVRGKSVEVDDLNLDDVSQNAGDYSAKSLTEHLISAEAQRITAETYAEFAGDRRGIVFVPTVDAIAPYAAAFESQGISTATVWGAQPKLERLEAIERVRHGERQVIINCGVLTEGFDVPELSCCVIARPTRSSNRFVQMVGRVLRPAKGKNDALVLDTTGTAGGHTLATLADLSSRRIREIKPEETLANAARREKKERNPYLENYIVTYKELQLFEDTRTRWLTTKKGIYFIPCSTEWVFIWPDFDNPGMYAVGWRSRKRQEGNFELTNLTLDVAFAHGEGMAREREGYTNLLASWRSAPISEKQFNYAVNLGLSPTLRMTKGQVNDIIEVHQASKVLDWALR